MQLAIKGGEPIRTTPFFPWPYYDNAEKEALIRALEQGQWWRMSGQEVRLFEEEFANFHASPGGALAVSNGTHALEIALLTLGIGKGDEVIVPAFTFISTSMAVQRVGAVAIPVDVDLGNYCMAIDSVRDVMTEKTKAIIPVHIAGHCIDMIEFEKFATEREIFIIQDACHAHGAECSNKKLGEWNSISCFSFQNFKLMTAGEGGALLFPTRELREKAFIFHNCGRPMNDRSYDHRLLGSNYRLNEFSAAILREQLKRLKRHSEIREINTKFLYRELEKIDGIIPQQRSSFTTLQPYYMAMFRIDPAKYPHLNRDDVVNALVAEGIPAYKNYRSIYKTEAFWLPPAPRGDQNYWMKRCPNTEKISTEGVWIHHSAMLGGQSDVIDVVNAVKKVLELL